VESRSAIRDGWRAAGQWTLGGVAVALVALVALTVLLLALHVGLTVSVVAALAFGTAAVVVMRLLSRLRESEAQWRDVFENNPTMYFIVDAGGTVLSVNPFGAEQLGHTVDELVGTPVLRVFHEDDRQAVTRHVAECLAHLGRAMSWELRKIRKDGSMLWVRETAKAVERAPNRPIVLVACEDITDRKRAEGELRRSQDYLAEAQRLSRTGSFGWNAATGELVWSDETYRIVGVDRATTPTIELVLERTHPDDVTLVRRTLARAAVDGAGFDIEHRLVMPDESIRQVHVVAHPVLDDTGTLEIVGATMDVTEQRRAEEALRQAQSELARVMRLTTMGELAASIAHEIRQPLAAIVINGEALLRWLNRDEPDLGEARDAVGRIVRDAGRAEDVIRGLRTLARKSGPQLSPLDLTATIEEVLTLTAGELRRQDVSVHTELDPGGRPIVGDRVQLQQVLLNLILNGVEAMSAIHDRPRVLTIRSEGAGPAGMVVSVEDSGPGIDPATADQLFEPFFTTKRDGLGIGLSICRSIIETHGGRIWAEPRAPHGAAFRFTVPAVADA
jgi:PAS domain S-box-containing protein